MSFHHDFLCAWLADLALFDLHLDDDGATDGTSFGVTAFGQRVFSLFPDIVTFDFRIAEIAKKIFASLLPQLTGCRARRSQLALWVGEGTDDSKFCGRTADAQPIAVASSCKARRYFRISLARACRVASEISSVELCDDHHTLPPLFFVARPPFGGGPGEC